MENKDIEQLIERFLGGETTLAEERKLYAFFAHEEDVPEELRDYTEFFRDLAVLPQPEAKHKPSMENPTATGKPSTPPLRHISISLWPRLAAGIAASLILAVGITLGYRSYENDQLARRYGGSYIIVNGQRIDDLRQIKDSIIGTLAEARQVEHSVSRQSVVKDAEQDVLESISPTERKEMEQFLNGM